MNSVSRVQGVVEMKDEDQKKEKKEEEDTGLTSYYYISYKPSDNAYKQL